MKRGHLISMWFCILASLGVAHSHETQTHAYITYQAYLNSNLGNGNADVLLERLGLNRLDPDQPFSPYWLLLPDYQDFYYDNAPSGGPLQYLRPVTGYEWAQMRQLQSAGVLGSQSGTIVGDTPYQPLPITNWLMRGAIREDDLVPGEYVGKTGFRPDADPHGSFQRVYNHFYDPIHNRKLNMGPDCDSFPSIPPIYGYDFCSKSVNWALGTVGAFNSLEADSSRHQHFSWADARNNFFLALTAERDADSNGARDAAEREADSEERLYRWATTFRSLGDVVHLLQDASQPQHTRNDRHDPHVHPNDQQGYEPFTNARLLQNQYLGGNHPTGGQKFVRTLSHKAFAQFATRLPDIDGYPIPDFATPLRFFTTRNPGDGPGVSPDNRYGMADYSNRGFFTRGTTPDANTALPGVFDYPEPDRTLSGFTQQSTPCAELPSMHGILVDCTTYYHSVSDPVQPGRSDAITPQPLLAQGMWWNFSLSVSENKYTLTPRIYQAMGDLTIPRAIAYSAGLLDYFFRGQLEVTRPPNQIVGVLNQGATHLMNAQGYPCVGLTAYDGCPIFGFQSIRLNVRNVTPQITESGTGTVITQDLSSTIANPGPGDARLVAVARYHRNTCYQPDLSGERVQGYSSSPPAPVTEPECASGQTIRTAYPEVSVSKSAALSAAELNASSPATVHFDFSDDPIPVNATDVFIQVVYRGPMGDAALGTEPDAIAVGTLDVREPSFVAFWNNTDYWWNGSNWLAHTSTYPNDSARDFWVCAGGAPPKLVFYYQGGNGAPAMSDPVSGANIPGVVRLGFLFPPPDFAGQRKIIRGVPVAYPISGLPQIPIRSTYTSGQFRQANLANITAATLAMPVIDCGDGLPSTPQYWCFDPIQKRRGQRLGAPAQPLYLEPTGWGTYPNDVDSVPLPAFTAITPLASGTIRFDTDTTLQNCPGQPSFLAQPLGESHAQMIRLREEAASLGVDPR